MQLADREWLLYCRQCDEWTGLHRFLPKRGHFQGEHSLTLNAFLESDLLLGKFLIHHADHELTPVPDLSEHYKRIRLHKDRFLHGLIDDIVEERIHRDQEQRSQVESQRREGLQNLLTLRGIFAERLKELDAQHPDDPGQAKVHLGKYLGVSWCQGQIDYLLEFRQR